MTTGYAPARPSRPRWTERPLAGLVRLAVVLGLAGAEPARAAKTWGQDASGSGRRPAAAPEPQASPADVPEDEPGNDLCPGQPLACGGVLRPASLGSGDVDHVHFTANGGDVVVLGTDADGGEIADTVIELLDADCGTVLGADDDGGPGFASLLSFCVPATGRYVLRIRHFEPGGTGTYRAFVTCTSPDPAGDDCAAATSLPYGHFELSGDTACHRDDYSPIESGTGGCTGSPAHGPDVIFSVVAETNFVLDVTYTSQLDGVLYLVRGCPGETSSDCVAGADAANAGEPERLRFTEFRPPGIYYLVLDGFVRAGESPRGGAWTLVGSFGRIVGVVPASWSRVKLIYRGAGPGRIE